MRAAKLRLYANSMAIPDMSIIAEMLRYHELVSDQVRRLILKHLTTDRANLKKQLCIVGPSNSGKTSLTRPLTELLSTARLPTSNSRLKFQKIANADIDVLYASEIQKSIKSGSLTEEEFIDLFEDSANLTDPYCSFEPHLPVIANTQGTYYTGVNNTKVDFKSITNRPDMVMLTKGELPTREHCWMITKESMSYWLYNPTSADILITECITEMGPLIREEAHEDDDEMMQPNVQYTF